MRNRTGLSRSIRWPIEPIVATACAIAEIFVFDFVYRCVLTALCVLMIGLYILRLRRDREASRYHNDLEVISALSDKYALVCSIDTAHNEVEFLHMNDKIAAILDRIDDRIPSNIRLDCFFRRFIPPEEFGGFRTKVCKRAEIIEMLKREKSYDIQFHGVTGDIVSTYSLRFAADEQMKDCVVFGIRDIEEENIIRGINVNMMDKFIGTYVIDVDRDRYRILKVSSDVKVIRSREDNVWSEACADFLPEVTEETAGSILSLCRSETIREELANTDSREHLYRLKSGGHWMRATMEVLEREDERVIKTVVYITELDEHEAEREELNLRVAEQKKQLEKQQEQLEEALVGAQSASEAKTRFLFNMSHDIRTPMNAITGYVSMAKKDLKDPERVGECLDKISSAGTNLLQIVNQVLDMSRIESGKVTISEDPVNVIERAREMVSMISQNALNKNITLSCCTDGVRDRRIYADVGRMNQIMMNILGNAVKYTPNDGRVEFIVTQEDTAPEGFGRFVFTVSDTGIGMSSEFISQIYEPFSRETSTTVSRIEGTGLGMSIVKKLVDLLGGTIDIESQIGAGTTIRVTLDLRLQNDEEALTEHVIETDTRGLKDKRILLVEDNEMNREIAGALLKDQGLIVDDAADGDIAVDMIRELVENSDTGYYDLILMDVQMHHMSGYDATREIRQMLDPLGVHIPIVAMTANAFEEDRQNAIDAGMDEHLAKPIDVDRMWEVLTGLMKHTAGM